MSLEENAFKKYEVINFKCLDSLEKSTTYLCHFLGKRMEISENYGFIH